MTERYSGWSQHQNSNDIASRHEMNSTSAHVPSGFTAINHNISSHVAPSFHTLDRPQSTSHDQTRHPQLVAQYLGLGEDDTLDSHLDQLARVHISPPPSPSEKNISKRKRAGERITKEIKQAVKRTKSNSDDENNVPPSKRPTSRSNVARRRTTTSTSTRSTNRNQSTAVDTSASTVSPPFQVTDIQPSQESLSRLSDWRYGSQSARKVESSSPNHGVVSLVAPVTSMDRFRGVPKNSRDLYEPGTESAISTIRPDPVQLPRQAISRIRRAPSTGRPLKIIHEEIRVETQTGFDASSVNNSKVTEVADMLAGDYASTAAVPIFHSSPSLVSTAKESFPPSKRRHEIKDHVMCVSDDEFDGVDDDDLLRLGIPPKSMATKSCTASNASLPTPQTSDDNSCIVINDDDGYDWSQLSERDLETLDLTAPNSFVANTASDEPRENMTSLISQDVPGQRLEVIKPAPSCPSSLGDSTAIAPFARPAFPDSIQDRSPLLNITSTLTLKTCFRIGEAINIGAHYARQSSSFTSDGILIELYARVLSSARPPCHSGTRQDFLLGDLWSKNGPTLAGEWTNWKGSKVFEADAKNLLTEEGVDCAAKMCRVIGRLKREKKEWRFVMLSALECDWDDVSYVRGIICQEC